MAGPQEHPSKVGGWRQGRFVVMPEVKQADSVVWFAFDAEGQGGMEWEGLLATRAEDDIATVLGVPYFVYNLSLGDRVRTMESAEGALVGVGPLERSDFVTFRVVFDGPEDDRWQRLMRDLERWSGWADVRTPGFVAIAAPSKHAQAVADYLHEREGRGELQYETGSQ